ncbi:sphingosine-1-phosphate lyase protein [Staphylotrichum tortipilum]|uniref:sphinganine-1-phosphate aldolase n=1 Tax=Staphylotrichum tortipilum TaxID=2831512 RepID=A0AAN6RQR4_9PEZI|nr:sphingosine-1-phosphate lyase protein [Staphylotrichum longicolle]
MHFALPPRKTSQPPPYLPRSSTTRLLLPGALRRGRGRLVAVVVGLVLTVVFLLSRSGGNGRNGGGSGNGGWSAPSGKPPVVLVTVLDASRYGPGYLETVKRNRVEYAEMHGYGTLLAKVGDYDLHGAPFSWTTVVAMRDALTKFPDCRYVWFLDASGFIMNPKLKVEDYIMAPARLDELMKKDYPVVPPDSIIKTFSHLKGRDVDMVLTQDKDGLSSGSYIVRNGEWARFFLETWYDPLYRSYNFQKAETHALEHIVQWHPTILSRMAIVDQQLLNSYSKGSRGEEYKDGDLVVRFPDCATAGENALRNALLFLFVLRWTRRALWKLRGRGLLGTLAELYADVRRVLYGWFLRMPGVRSQVRRQVDEALAGMQSKLVPAGGTRYLTLPKEGWAEDDVRKELEALASMDHTRWEDGYVSGAVYHGEDELLKLQTEAYGKFTVANPIHPDVFPGVRKMEAEVVAMVLSLFNAPPGAAGVSTSGGTESILMACLSARQKAYVERGVTEPEMILPETAHTAFRKAGEYFKIKIHVVSCPAPEYQVDLRRVSRLINRNTILLVGSAPNFPHGIIDDIAGLSKIALKRRLPLHVDCCLGSFLVPFLEKAGFPSAPFDFRLKGVTSISCDTHKYGFAPKGNSTVLYRTQALRSYQYFVDPSWSGGVYASPGIAGSRPGALIAGCWASLVSVGEAGYLASCVSIVGTTKKILAHISSSPALSAELEVLGTPLVSVLAFRARNLNVYDLADGMSARGWHLNALQSPAAIHVAVTLPLVKVWEKLVADLEAVIEAEREKERVRLVEGKKPRGADKGGDAAALYGVAGSLPNKSVVVDLARGFLDLLYKA